jgi:hypothetical protein
MTSPGLFGTKSSEENARMEHQGMGTVPTVVGNTYIEKAIGNYHNIPHEAAALISTYSSSLPTYQACENPHLSIYISFLELPFESCNIKKFKCGNQISEPDFHSMNDEPYIMENGLVL